MSVSSEIWNNNELRALGNWLPWMRLSYLGRLLGGVWGCISQSSQWNQGWSNGDSLLDGAWRHSVWLLSAAKGCMRVLWWPLAEKISSNHNWWSWHGVNIGLTFQDHALQDFRTVSWGRDGGVDCRWGWLSNSASCWCTTYPFQTMSVQTMSLAGLVLAVAAGNQAPMSWAEVTTRMETCVNMEMGPFINTSKYLHYVLDVTLHQKKLKLN